VRALIGKELTELRSNPLAILPVAILVLICVALPVVTAVLIPRITGTSLGSDRTIARVIAVTRPWMPSLAALPPEAAAEAFMFQQFLFLFLVAPIVGAVSLAAYSVVGEKQGRTLEPLLTTPVSTAELLVAKVLAAFLPSMAIELAGLTIYAALVAAIAQPGVVASLVSVRTGVLVGLLGPSASLVALQITIAISSRVNDPRSAQQIAVILVLPLVVVLVGQIAGAFIVTASMLATVSAALFAVWLLLIALSVALFERETILTRWK
jgi:ABC-2 type transport system permease protein